MDRFMLLLLSWLVTCPLLSATPQLPDKIILNGDTVTLISWLKEGPFDKDLFRAQRPESYSTACWDGYYPIP